MCVGLERKEGRVGEEYAAVSFHTCSGWGWCLWTEEESYRLLVDGLRRALPTFRERVAVSRPIMSNRQRCGCCLGVVRPSARVRKNAGRVGELVGGGLGRDGKCIGKAETGSRKMEYVGASMC